MRLELRPPSVWQVDQILYPVFFPILCNILSRQQLAPVSSVPHWFHQIRAVGSLRKIRSQESYAKEAVFLFDGKEKGCCLVQVPV